MATKDISKAQIIIYPTEDGKTRVVLYGTDGTVWMNQQQLAELFTTSVPNISMHISNILKDNELIADSVIKYYLSTGPDGKNYEVGFYSLDMILAIGFRVRSKRGVQFRQWAGRHLKEYMQKGFVMDDERLKNPDGRPDYFDELLERIRDIRAGEKRFYQKVRDLLALSSDYDATDKVTQMFFAETQNKILYAITGKTAAEIIVNRANAESSNMALTSWQGNKVRKQDITIAKNYLTHDELDSLNRFVMVFLETAELRAKNRQDLTLAFWRENIDKIINLNDRPLLQGKGSISHEQMEALVEKVYAQFDARRRQDEALTADVLDAAELKVLEEQLKKRKP
jgi:hypothetical protein